MRKIAVDIMGSDLGYEVLATGLKNYLKDNKDVSFLVFGDREKLMPVFSDVSNRVEIEDAKDVIPMEIKPLDFLRKRESSMYKAILSVKEGRADAVVSAGSTGGFVTGCSLLLRNIPGVTRAGLISPFPTVVKGKATVLLDIGANNTNTPEDLVGFAKMGKLYAELVLKEKNPKTYLLSNGAEEGKGTDEIVQAYKLLKDMNFEGFSGNCEARDALDGKHDVIVMPGFSGNVLLKSAEGTFVCMNGLLKKAFTRNIFTKIGYLFVKGGIKDMKDTMDYRRYGGAILLGINGACVKAHGNSNAYAFYHAIRVADDMIKSSLLEKMKDEFNRE